MEFHILNGDALAAHLPLALSKNCIIMRECLIEGPLNGLTLHSFFETRAAYLNTVYKNTGIDYYQYVVPQINAITQLPNNATVNLWFEEDVFCQINLWFVCSLLAQKNTYSINLVKPLSHSPYSFGNLTSQELETCYEQRKQLSNIQLWSDLWFYAQSKQYKLLLQQSNLLKINFPFVHSAVKAYIDFVAPKATYSKATTLLHTLIESSNTNDFSEIYKLFTKKAPIYGLSDLQVKKMYDDYFIGL